MKWGCHSFEGGKFHAIFRIYVSNDLESRLHIIWNTLFKKGIVGYIYSTHYGSESKSIERDFEYFADYGIVHGEIDHDTHNYILALASLRKIAREGETTQEVVIRLIEEHKAKMVLENAKADIVKKDSV